MMRSRSSLPSGALLLTAVLLAVCVTSSSVHAAPVSRERRPGDTVGYDFEDCTTRGQFNFWGNLGTSMAKIAGLPLSRNMPGRSPLLPGEVVRQRVRPEEICIFSLFGGAHEGLRSVMEPNKQAYADAHGYRYFSESTEPAFASLPSAYHHMNKMKRGLQILEQASPRCEWVFWTDGDAFFNRFDIKLEDYINVASESVDLIFSWDEKPMPCLEEGDERWTNRNLGDFNFLRLNSGHWFARNSLWTRVFLQETMRFERSTRAVYTYWHDQGALAETIALRGEKAIQEGHYQFYDLRSFNTHIYPPYSSTVKSDFILHRVGGCRKMDSRGLEGCEANLLEALNYYNANRGQRDI